MSIETLRNTLSPEIVSLVKSAGPLGFDLDGVFVDLAVEAVGLYNTLHGGQYTIKDIHHTWSMNDWYMEKYKCSEEEAFKATGQIWNSKACLEGAKPMEGATEIANFLEINGVEHYFITSRPFSTLGFTTNWFNMHIKQNPISRLLLQTSNEYNKRHKIERIIDYGIKYHFEDMTEHALTIAKETEATVVLVNYLANRNIPANPRIIRPVGLHTEGSLIHTFVKFVEHLQALKYK